MVLHETYISITISILYIYVNGVSYRAVSWTQTKPGLKYLLYEDSPLEILFNPV